MQMYWYPSGRNRKIGSLPIVYLREDERWVPRRAVFVRPPGGMTTSETSRWNYLCIQCHATHGRTRPIPPDTMDTKVVEFGIACEACHGPAEEHVEVNRNPLRRYALHDAPDDETRDETIVDPSKLNHRRSAEVCGQCHSIAMEYREEVFRTNLMLGDPYRPGDVLGTTRALARGLESDNPSAMQAVTDHFPQFFEESFWSDGTVRVAGREYNGLLETPCFERGEMSCVSCHVLHQKADDGRTLDAWRDDQLKPGMRGNLACTQCHEKYRDDATIEAHTHHKAESTGSNCYNCHMPYTTYGLLKGIRSHTILSPTAQESIEVKRPNACNQCHLDKTLLWTAEYLEKWYETPQPVLEPDDRTIAASVLWLFRGDAGLRALTAWSMGWEDARSISGGDDWIAPHLARTLVDPYDAVRFISGRSLRRLEGFEDFEYDFMAAPGLLAAAPRSALQRWSRFRAGRRVPEQPRTVLLDDAGLALASEVGRLLQQRDDSRVVLAE
jgi:hypothetical protein